MATPRIGWPRSRPKPPSFPKAPPAPGQAYTVFTHSPAHMRYWWGGSLQIGVEKPVFRSPLTTPGVHVREQPPMSSPQLWGREGLPCPCRLQGVRVAVPMLILFSLSLPPSLSYFWFHLGGFTITGMDLCSPLPPPFPPLNGHMLTLLFPLGFLFAFVLSWRETLEG